MFARQEGRDVDSDHLARHIEHAVDAIVAKQAAVGIDVVSDGEMSKPSYASYVTDRLTGFEGESTLPQLRDLIDFPAVAESCFGDPGNERLNANRPACNGPVTLADVSAAQRDIANYRRALKGVEVVDAFMTAASPGLIAMFLGNAYYATEEEFLWDIAVAMKPEYEAIVEAGFMLQLDCPDLAMARHREFADRPLADFRDYMRLHIDVLNSAVSAIPPERMRMHVCWGNYPGPHHHDVPLREIVDLIMEARPAGLAFEAANPRHEHEWLVFRDVNVPDGKVLIPGVIDSVSNCVEHPELVAQRIVRFAEVVGRERVIAGSDCGFGTFVGVVFVDPGVAWKKLAALVEGARIASARLW
jgi:5-methyltetrahydropteroyltriglutamate--homocysteine methyltransferase